MLPSRVSIRALTIAYLLLLAVATIAWWTSISGSDAARDLFAGVDGWRPLRALAIANLAMLCGLSLLAAIALQQRWRLAPLLVAVQAGAVLYATLAAAGMALVLDTGWLGVVALVPCAVVSTATAAIPWLRGMTR